MRLLLDESAAPIGNKKSKYTLTFERHQSKLERTNPVFLFTTFQVTVIKSRKRYAASNLCRMNRLIESTIIQIIVVCNDQYYRAFCLKRDPNYNIICARWQPHYNRIKSWCILSFSFCFVELSSFIGDAENVHRLFEDTQTLPVSRNISRCIVVLLGTSLSGYALLNAS
jgi:hypothetical protein